VAVATLDYRSSRGRDDHAWMQNCKHLQFYYYIIFVCCILYSYFIIFYSVYHQLGPSLMFNVHIFAIGKHRLYLRKCRRW
jgi:hypothetical protein